MKDDGMGWFDVEGSPVKRIPNPGPAYPSPLRAMSWTGPRLGEAIDSPQVVSVLAATV